MRFDIGTISIQFRHKVVQIEIVSLVQEICRTCRFLPSVEWVWQLHFSVLIRHRSCMHSKLALGGGRENRLSRPRNWSHVAIVNVLNGMGLLLLFRFDIGVIWTQFGHWLLHRKMVSFVHEIGRSLRLLPSVEWVWELLFLPSIPHRSSINTVWLEGVKISFKESVAGPDMYLQYKVCEMLFYLCWFDIGTIRTRFGHWVVQRKSFLLV